MKRLGREHRSEHGHGHDEHGHGHDEHQHRHGHGHDEHQHGHGHSALGRLRHAASDLLGGHSHDPADRVDQALESDAAGRRALWISLVVLAATAGLQALVVAVSGSVALLGDTLHNFADALTAGPLLIAFWLGRRPPNARFTYGYGRAEDLAGLFVLLMISLSGIFAAVVAVDRLLHPARVGTLWAVGVAAVVGFLGNEAVARYRIRVGYRIGSAALVADGLHARTDGFTSLGVLVGLAGVALGWQQADPIVGLLITAAIVGVLRSAARQVGARLLDAVDPALVAQATAAVTAVDGIDAVTELRIRWIGHTMRAEVDVTVAASLTVDEAHQLAHHAEAHLLEQVPRLAVATVHVSPAGAHSASTVIGGHRLRPAGDRTP